MYTLELTRVANTMHLLKVHIEAFEEDDGVAHLLATDPHLLEGGQRGQEGAPIHTEYLHSGGAMLLIFLVLGARAMIPCFHQ